MTTGYALTRGNTPFPPFCSVGPPPRLAKIYYKRFRTQNVALSGKTTGWNESKRAFHTKTLPCPVCPSLLSECSNSSTISCSSSSSSSEAMGIIDLLEISGSPQELALGVALTGGGSDPKEPSLTAAGK